MGIQSWKRGLHSGNTFRLGGAMVIRKCSDPPHLVKRTTAPVVLPTTVENTSEEDGAIKKHRRRGRRHKKTKTDNDDENRAADDIEEGLEDFEENVLYSLNKKGRWNLPEQIKREIKYTNHSLRAGEKLQRNTILMEYHSRKPGHNCVGFYSTKFPGDGSVSKSKTYINSESILTPVRNRRSRRRRSRRSPTDSELENDDTLPATHLFVSYSNATSEFRQSERFCQERYISTAPTVKASVTEEIQSEISRFYEDRWSNYDDRYDCELSTNPKPKSKKRPVKVEDNSETEGDSYVWFLKEFVTVNKSDLDDCETDEEETEIEKEKEAKKNVDSIETESSLLCDDDWEILKDEPISERGKEEAVGDLGILGQLIDAALISKMSAAQDSISKQKSKRRKRKKTNSASSDDTNDNLRYN